MKRLSLSSLAFVAINVLTAASALSPAGCSQTSSATNSHFEALSVDWGSKTASVTKNLATLQAKLDGLPKETIGRGAVQTALNANQAALKTLQSDYAKLKTEAAEVFNLGTDLDKDELIEHAKELGAQMNELGATIDEEKSMIGEAQEKAEKASKDARDAVESASAAAALDAARTATLAKLASEGGDANFSEIAFIPGSAGFDLSKPGTQKALDALVTFAAACGRLRFELIGHTDHQGDDKANQKLSEERAAAVKAYLVERKIDAASITVSGAGATRPLIEEPEAEKLPDAKQLAEAREKNRRIVVHVTKKCG
jgi:outer membrane protein OmpA-like peptidoglycan-associated protein